MGGYVTVWCRLEVSGRIQIWWIQSGSVLPGVTFPTGPVDPLTPGQSAEVVDYVWDALGAESRGPSTFFFAIKLDQL